SGLSEVLDPRSVWGGLARNKSAGWRSRKVLNDTALIPEGGISRGNVSAVDCKRHGDLQVGGQDDRYSRQRDPYWLCGLLLSDAVSIRRAKRRSHHDSRCSLHGGDSREASGPRLWLHDSG